MSDDDGRHIYLTPVKADRADDFEEWLRETLAPAVRKAKPELAGRWRALRAAPDDEGVVFFAFLLDGGQASEWEIDPILRAALGADAAASGAALWDEMLAGAQIGATFLPVEL